MADDRQILILESIAQSLELIASNERPGASTSETTLQDARRALIAFGVQLRYIREAREHTLARVASDLFINQPELSRIERGLTMPTNRQQKQLEQYLYD